MIKKININDPQAWRDLDWEEPQDPELLKKTDQKVAVARANRLTKTTKEFREKVTVKNKAQAKDPKWKAATTRANQRKALDDAWLEANRRGAKARGDKQRGKTRDPHSAETKQKQAEAASTRWSDASLREQHSIRLKGIPKAKIKCQHCAKEMSANNLKRHGHTEGKCIA